MAMASKLHCERILKDYADKKPVYQDAQFATLRSDIGPGWRFFSTRKAPIIIRTPLRSQRGPLPNRLKNSYYSVQIRSLRRAHHVRNPIWPFVRLRQHMPNRCSSRPAANVDTDVCSISRTQNQPKQPAGQTAGLVSLPAI